MNSRLSARTRAGSSRRTVAIPILAGLLVLASPAGASARPARGWSFHIDYTVNPVPNVACGGFLQTDVGVATGDGRLFKQGVWNSTECIDFVVEPGVLHVDRANFSIATAKGTLLGTYDGTGTPFGIGHLRTTASVKLVGGTGAFAHLTGCGLAHGDSNLLNSADNHLDASGQFSC